MKNHIRIFAKLLLLTPLLTFCGCVSQQLNDDYTNYPRAYAAASDRQLLLNLARLSKDEPVNFLQLAQISSAYQYTTSVGDTLNYTVRHMPLGMSIPLAASRQANPTFQFIPISGSNFVQAVLNPLPQKVYLTMYDQGWPADLLVRTMASSIQHLQSITPIAITNVSTNIVTIFTTNYVMVLSTNLMTINSGSDIRPTITASQLSIQSPMMVNNTPVNINLGTFAATNQMSFGNTNSTPVFYTNIITIAGTSLTPLIPGAKDTSSSSLITTTASNTVITVSSNLLATSGTGGITNISSTITTTIISNGVPNQYPNVIVSITSNLVAMVNSRQIMVVNSNETFSYQANYEYWINDPHDPTYPQFLKFCNDLRIAQLTHALTVSSFSTTSTIFNNTNASLADAVNASQAGITLSADITGRITATQSQPNPELVENPLTTIWMELENTHTNPSSLTYDTDQDTNKLLRTKDFSDAYTNGNYVIKMRTFEAAMFCAAKQQVYFEEMLHKQQAQKADLFYNGRMMAYDQDQDGFLAKIYYADGNFFTVRPLLTLTYAGLNMPTPFSKDIDVDYDGVKYIIGDPYDSSQNKTVFTILSYLFAQTAISTQNLPIQQLIQVQ